MTPTDRPAHFKGTTLDPECQPPPAHDLDSLLTRMANECRVDFTLWNYFSNAVLAMMRDNATLRAQLAEAQKERDPLEIRRQFDAHLAGCAALDEMLKEIGLTEDDGTWTNTRAEKAEARVAALEAALRGVTETDMLEHAQEIARDALKGAAT